MFRSKISAAAAALAVMAVSPAAMASLIGTTVDMTAAGGTVLASGPASATVGAGNEFFVCVGAASNVCSTSGLSVGVDISASAITISFVGSTNAAQPFTIDLSGFDETILSVVLAASRPLATGSFGLTSFDGDSILFSGTPSGIFNGTNQAFYTYNLTTAAVPEPASIALVGLALAGLGLSSRRRKSA